VRLTVVSESRISGPHRLAKYTGTSGSTQGDTKEASPAPKAAKSDMFSISVPVTALMLIDLTQNFKLNNNHSIIVSPSTEGLLLKGEAIYCPDVIARSISDEAISRMIIPGYFSGQK